MAKSDTSTDDSRRSAPDDRSQDRRGEIRPDRPRSVLAVALGTALGTLGTVLGATSGATVTPTTDSSTRPADHRAGFEPIALRAATRTGAGDVVCCGTARSGDSPGRVCLTSFQSGDNGPQAARGSTRPLRGADLDVVGSIATGRDDEFVVAGTASSSPGTQSARGDGGASKAVVIRTDADGRVRARTVLGGPGYVSCRDLVRAHDGGHLLAGSAITDGASGMDAWIAKVAADGDVAWTETLSKTDGDCVAAVDRTPDGGYALAVNVAGDRNDRWLVKVDGRGSLEWDRTLGGAGYDRATAVAGTADGGALVGGHARPAGAENATARIARLDPPGDVVWDRTDDSPNRSTVHDVLETESGVAIVGQSTAPGDETRGFVAAIDDDGMQRWRRTFDSKTCARAVLPGSTDRRWTVVGTTSADGPRRTHPWVATVDAETGRPSDGT